MWKTCFAAAVAVSPATALASDEAAQAAKPFETCMLAQALALERTGAGIDEVVGAAQRACRDTKGPLADRAAAEVTDKVRLAVMQQRLNARNTRRRG